VVVGVDVVDVFHAFTDFAAVVKLVRKFVVLDRAVAVDVEEIEQDRDVLLTSKTKGPKQNCISKTISKNNFKKDFQKKLDFLSLDPQKRRSTSPYLGHERLVLGVVVVLLVGNAGDQRDKHV